MTRDIIDDVIRTLRVPPRRQAGIERELRAHLEDTQRDLQLAGWTPEAAKEESVARLGDPREIAAGFERVYRPSRRKQVGMAFALAGGLLMGAYGASGGLASATATHHAKAAQVSHLTHHVKNR